MIRINLLPTKVSKKKETLRQQMILGGVALAVEVAVCLVLYNRISGRVGQTQAKIRQANEELKRLQAIVGDAKVLEQKKADVDAKLKVIDQLEQGRLDPVHFLDEMAKAIPVDKNPQAVIQKKVTLSALRNKGGVVEIQGIAADEDGIATFMTNLSKSGRFQGVTLVSTQTKESGGFLLREFSLHATYVPPAAGGGM